MKTQIGKIQSISLGFGGYQDTMIGVSVMLGSETDSWSVQDFQGTWSSIRDDFSEWTEERRLTTLGEVTMWVKDLLTDAKKTELSQLVGAPIEATFEDNLRLKSWRILTEVI